MGRTRSFPGGPRGLSTLELRPIENDIHPIRPYWVFPGDLLLPGLIKLLGGTPISLGAMIAYNTFGEELSAPRKSKFPTNGAVANTDPLKLYRLPIDSFADSDIPRRNRPSEKTHDV